MNYYPDIRTDESVVFPQPLRFSKKLHTIIAAVGTAFVIVLAPSEAKAENALFVELYTSPVELFQTWGLAGGFGHELVENEQGNFHLGFEIGVHCELGLSVLAGACLATIGPSFGFEINNRWEFELVVPQMGAGFSFVIPGSVDADFYQNGTKGPFGVVGIETLVKRELRSGWHYYFGAAYHWLIYAEDPSVPRGTPPELYTHDFHLIPVGLEKEF